MQLTSLWKLVKYLSAWNEHNGNQTIIKINLMIKNTLPVFHVLLQVAHGNSSENEEKR